MNSNPIFGFGVCQYKKCRKVFERTVIGQRFCCINHRKYAYNERKQATDNKNIIEQDYNVCSICGIRIEGDTTTICIHCYETRTHNIPYYRVGEIIN